MSSNLQECDGLNFNCSTFYWEFHLVKLMGWIFFVSIFCYKFFCWILILLKIFVTQEIFEWIHSQDNFSFGKRSRSESLFAEILRDKQISRVKTRELTSSFGNGELLRESPGPHIEPFFLAHQNLLLRILKIKISSNFPLFLFFLSLAFL